MSCLIPVPKTSVALTSHIKKTMERLILDQLRSIVRPHQDPLQIAYQPLLRVEDANIYLLNRVYAHLYQPAGTVRVMFFGFAIASNTIRSTLLGDKLTAM